MATAPRVEVASVTLEATVGDITDQPDVEAVVNAANAQLLPGGGVAGAIHRAAGPGLAAECRPLAPIEPGQCVLTGGHQLPNRNVLHCLGPVHGVDEPAAELLAACYRNALQIADAQGLRSVAFPAISTGAFGYPVSEAAEVAVRTVAETAAGLSSVEYVRFVLFDQAGLDAHAAALRSLPTDG
jgi:O-acetyl-ADP-ribose deacetylase